MLLGGALGALVYGQPDLTEVLNSQGLLAVGLLLVVLSIWVVTQDTVYAFSVAGANLLRTEKRRAIVVGGSLVGIILAISGFYNYLVDYLILLGTFIPPVGAVIAADFFIKRRMRLPALAVARLPAYNWAGILAYLAGSAVALFSPGIPPVNGIVAGFVAYLVLDRAFEALGVGRREAGVEGEA
jgi:cytosine permease